MTLRLRRYHEGTPEAPVSVYSLEAPAPDLHEVPDYYVANARDEGFLSVTDTGEMVWELREGQLTYKILTYPGKRVDPREPAGYVIEKFYRLQLVSQPPTHDGRRASG